MLKLSLLFFLIFFSASASFAGLEQPALVIIDMQAAFFTRPELSQQPANVEKLRTVLRTQVEAIRLARRARLPIVVIEYYLPPSGTHISLRHTVPELKGALAGYGNVRYFMKYFDGAFDERDGEKVKLLEHLSKSRIKTLIVTGANGRSCVASTIEGAVTNGFKIVSFSPGIADFGSTDFIYPYVENPSVEPAWALQKADSLKELSALVLNR
ncbi:MAG: isochorismatase family protein [Bdellovibrionia bacterium]